MSKLFWRLVMQINMRYWRRFGLFILIAAVIFFGYYSKTRDYISLPTPLNVFEQLDSARYRLRFDVSQKYTISEFAIVGENWKTPRKPSPCLATQGSVTYLRHLLPMGRRWQGLVSVAVLVPGDDIRLVVLHIENMRRCHPEVMANVTFHFVYPVDYPPSVTADDTLLDINDCSEGNLDVGNLTRFNSTKILYPQNLLRNVASKTCPTEHVLVADIDMIPSLGMASQLDAFLANATHCPKCAYVIPAYEVQKNAIVPSNKSELLAMVRQNQTRPYRQVAFDLNQGATNATRWQELPEGDVVSVGYRLPCFKFFYEPFYLTGGPIPPFDERFVGYGFTRNTQHEMVDKPYASPGRKNQVKANKMRYDDLKKEFSVKYKKVDELPCASAD